MSFILALSIFLRVNCFLKLDYYYYLRKALLIGKVYLEHLTSVPPSSSSSYRLYKNPILGWNWKEISTFYSYAKGK
jgi:hypothetical protein